MESGFGGGLVVDFPNSRKAKKYTPLPCASPCRSTVVLAGQVSTHTCCVFVHLTDISWSCPLECLTCRCQGRSMETTCRWVNNPHMSRWFVVLCTNQRAPMCTSDVDSDGDAGSGMNMDAADIKQPDVGPARRHHQSSEMPPPANTVLFSVGQRYRLNLGSLRSKRIISKPNNTTPMVLCSYLALVLWLAVTRNPDTNAQIPPNVVPVSSPETGSTTRRIAGGRRVKTLSGIQRIPLGGGGPNSDV